MIPDPEKTTLVKTALVVFRYDTILTTWGWEHEVYFDMLSRNFVIIDFPKEGDSVDVKRLELGKGKVFVRDELYKVRVYEK